MCIYCLLVDGLWKEWSAWAACDVTCGGGRQNRSRDCIFPQYGGEPCKGTSEEWTDCGTEPCPGEGAH